jgi:gamma-glutamyltranspeptidase/glutathione hydrolase
LNASGTAPEAWTPEYFKRKYGDDAQTPPKRGIDSVTVPGAVAGWVAMSERFGKLPFEDLLQPAIEIAERGYLLPVVVQQKWAAATPELQSLPGFAQSFLPWGRAPHVGELFKFSAAAKGLRAIAKSKGQAFYGGEIAQAIEAFSTQHGGRITARDFANYKAEWVTPISQNYRGYTLHEIPPNGQGIAALIALGILDNFDLASMALDGVDSQHVQIEAMKLAFADVYRYVAEPSAMSVTPAPPRSPRTASSPSANWQGRPTARTAGLSGSPPTAAPSPRPATGVASPSARWSARRCRAASRSCCMRSASRRSWCPCMTAPRPPRRSTSFGWAGPSA